MAHVADVGGAEAVLDLGRLDDAARPEVGAEGLEQRRIALHRLVDVVRALDDPERSARGLRRRLRARDDALLERPHVVEIDRAYVEDGGGELGDDVGRRAAVGDDAMDARVGAYLLAQHRHVGVGLDGGVERVHALPRVRGGVRRLARELQADAHDPEQVHVRDPAVPAVNHHRGVDSREDAALDEPHLAAAALLRRGADDQDAPGRQAIAHGREPGTGADAGGRDGVVAAGVPDARQRVVLAEDRDGRPFAGLERRAERGLDAGDAALHLEALRVEELGEPRGGLDFRVAELGVVVDPVREPLEIVTEAVHRLGDQLLEWVHGGLLVVTVRVCGADGAPHYTTAPGVIGFAA